LDGIHAAVLLTVLTRYSPSGSVLAFRRLAASQRAAAIPRYVCLTPVADGQARRWRY